MDDLVIIGAGDTGRELIDIVERINSVKLTWNLLGFVDDNDDIQGSLVEGFKVLGKTALLNDVKEPIFVICSISTGAIKKRVLSKINNPLIKYATLIDPNVTLCKGCIVEEGSVIYPGVRLAINSHINKHSYVGFNSTIGHDTVVGDYCDVYPGVNVSGKVVLEECVDLGTGARIIQSIRIGRNTVVGAGAVVIRNISDYCVAAGVPAKIIKRYGA